MGRKRKRNRHLPQNMRLSRGKFYLTAYHDGRQRWIPLGADYAQAFAEYARLTAYQSPAGHTVDDLADRFEAEVIPGLKPNTRKSYKSWLGPIRKTFGKIPVRALRQPDAAVYLDTFPNKVSANRHVTLLKTMLRKARRWGWVEVNVLDGLQLNAEKARQRVINAEEWQALLKHATPQARLAMRLARFTALRLSDVCGLLWGQVRDGRLIVTTGKTTAPISFEVAGELKAVLDELRGSVSPFPKVPLFPGRKGAMGARNLQRLFEEAREAAGLPDITFHDIRRTRITELSEKYGPAFAQRVATHADAKMTERYTVIEATRVDWPSEEIRDGKEAGASKSLI